MLTSYEKLMRLLGKSLGLEALQPKGSLQNHKQTSASIQPRVEAQDTDNINSFHSILYAAKISLFIIQSKYRQRFNIIIPQTLHIPLPSFEKQNNIPHDSRGKSPRPPAAFTQGRGRIFPHKKQNSDNIQLLMLSLFRKSVTLSTEDGEMHIALRMCFEIDEE